MEQNNKPRTPKPGPAKRQPAPLNPNSASDDAARKQKIAALKESVQNGTYRISSDDVARKLIEHMLRPKS